MLAGGLSAHPWLWVRPCIFALVYVGLFSCRMGRIGAETRGGNSRWKKSRQSREAGSYEVSSKNRGSAEGWKMRPV